ncbi:MAG: STAS domain-containing protein [Propionibacteriales bacterium]|nr:STAS domain-containing protein [Propionibacteriales bacterium]
MSESPGRCRPLRAWEAARFIISTPHERPKRSRIPPAAGPQTPAAGCGVFQAVYDVTRRLRLPTFVAPTRGDLIAGVSVALVLIPQSLAYAKLAGLEPIHGLYAAAAAPIAAAAIGSSPYLQTGPVALTSLLTLGALSPLATEGSADFAAHAMLLALLVGAARLALGLLRLGAVAYLMSVPVVTGFTVAAALLITASQVPSFVGLDADEANPVVAAARALAAPGQWSLAAIAVGLVTIGVVVGGRRISAVFPWILLATLAGLLASEFGVVDAPRVGSIPSGLPSLALDLPWSSFADLIVPAMVIAVVGFAEPASIARKYAAEDRMRWDPDREFVGQGLANLAAGAVGGYPAGGSFSRSALSRISGARTRWSGAISGIVVLAVLPAADVLSALPLAVLAGLVILAAVSLVDITPFLDYWDHSRPQFLVAVPTFVVTLAAAPRVERGLLVGVGLALAVHLWREMRLDVEFWRDGSTLHIRPHGVLYFVSAPILETRLTALLAEHPDITAISLDLQRLGRLDLTGLYALRDLVIQARAAGITVGLDDVPAHAAERVRAVLGPHLG